MTYKTVDAERWRLGLAALWTENIPSDGQNLNLDRKHCETVSKVAKPSLWTKTLNVLWPATKKCLDQKTNSNKPNWINLLHAAAKGWMFIFPKVQSET